MVNFDIDSEVEEKPKILGIKPRYFFILFGLSMLALYLFSIVLSWGFFILLILILSGIYIVMYYKTESFESNKVTDDLFPKKLSNNPNSEF